MIPIENVAFNGDVVSDRILVENYFGRMCSLCAILSHKYRRNEGGYNIIFHVCLVLNNYHITFDSLRGDDAEFNQTERNKLYTIGEELIRKR